MTWSKRSDGFSLVEILMVLTLVTVLGGITIWQISSNQDYGKWDGTKAKMEALRTAIVGDSTVDSEGHRRHFGFHGDMGRLPANLTELTTRGAMPAWTFNTYYGVGAGWRGPYVAKEILGEISVDKDAWGKTFLYNTAASAPSLISLGADNKSSGVQQNTDISVLLPTNERLATVSGILADQDTRISTKTVELRSPVNGTLTATTTVSTASGYFAFSSVPFGVRSLAVTGPNLTYGPNRFVAERPLQDVPSSTLNANGRIQAITTVGAPTNPCGSSTCVRAVLKNGYQSDLAFEYLTINWDRLAGGTTGYAQRMVFNGLTQLFPPVPPGTKVYCSSSIVFTANTSRTFELHFVNATTGAGTQNMSNTKFYVDFEWVGGKRDSLFFQTP